VFWPHILSASGYGPSPSYRGWQQAGAQVTNGALVTEFSARFPPGGRRVLVVGGSDAAAASRSRRDWRGRFSRAHTQWAVVAAEVL
jgi:hypothetical protein